MHFHTRLLGLLLATGSLGAAAQQSAEVTVSGSVTPVPCNVVLAGNGVADFGALVASDFSATDPNQLGSQFIGTTVTCTSGTQVAIEVTDNNSATAAPDNTPIIVGATATGNNVASSASASSFMGMGTAPNGAAIGNYIIAVTNAISDSTPAEMIRSEDSGATWAAAAHGVARENIYYTWATPGQTAPLSVSTATIDLKVTAAMDDMTTMNADADNITLAGSATLTLVYL
ncbi:hypothetical protein AB832_08060 [Flavobacteriaceae bacterium (ex Bugula neritina AB1)]|nr:hypothetical protein AB832_08060 [Flavobacteriaceae bacterium (ex Bugula neritina AB1)]